MEYIFVGYIDVSASCSFSKAKRGTCCPAVLQLYVSMLRCFCVRRSKAHYLRPIEIVARTSVNSDMITNMFAQITIRCVGLSLLENVEL